MKGYVIRASNPNLASSITYEVGSRKYLAHGNGIAVYPTPSEAVEHFQALVETWPEARWEIIVMPHEIKDTAQMILQRCPRLVAHMICHSLGYATPGSAANIIADAHAHRENWCEWIYACYNRNPRPALEQAVQGRKYHKGYMADYRQARAIVEHVKQGNEGPVFASWF